MMKTQVFILFTAIFAVSIAVFVPPRHHQNKQTSLGSKECTWGPSYWCQNLTSAAGCRAVRHCIQTVWIYKDQPAVDNTPICQTCLDMVKQARDQLESNETQELIKEVFDGSCALLHVKQIVKECDKIADQYIPDLIDTLASEMNPQVVCSVAGLCNNALLTGKVIEKTTTTTTDVAAPASDITQCQTCTNYLTTWKQNFLATSRDDVLNTFLRLCGKLGSYSDACSNYVLVYFSDIYNHIVQNFDPELICDVTQYCALVFHNHAQIEITPSSKIGYVSHEDLPCDFCKQLIVHLRDILITNTTELEFKKVLEGVCKQAKKFSTECLNLVDQYYDEIYQLLEDELDASAVCKEIGICPNGIKNVPIAPLLPLESVPKALEITPGPPKKQPLVRVKLTKDGASVKILSPEEMQLPIDLLVPPHTRVLYSPQVCTFCEYLLHYIQQQLTNPTSENEIREIIDKACNKLPASVNSTCVEFINMYEPALIAILAQEIDPSQVCPLIKACPSEKSKDVEIFMHEQQNEDSKCPLCLFAVAKLESMVKNKKTEDDIKEALGKLCSKLPNDLVQECNDFVNNYTNELVELLMADLTPQEICVYLKVCTAVAANIEDTRGDTRTNLIIDDTINGKGIETPTDSPQCIMCEFIAQQLQTLLKDKKTDDDIKNAVHNVCNMLPGTVKDECNQFIDQYGDTIIQLLIQATVPSEICGYLGVCKAQMEKAKVEIFECAICETLVYAIEKILANPSIDHNVEHVLEKACQTFPAHEEEKCVEIVQKYGKTIYELVIHLADKGLVCKTILLCTSQPSKAQLLVGTNKCSWGPGYWCASKENADICGNGAKKHCVERVWLGPEPRQ